MPAPRPRPTRRAVLVGGGATLVAACTSHGKPRAADPDATALDAARQRELALLASYDAASPARIAHLAHLAALGGAAPTPTPSAPTVSATAARAAEQASVAPLQTAALAAKDPDRAALLASIAASHAVLART